MSWHRVLGEKKSATTLSNDRQETILFEQCTESIQKGAGEWVALQNELEAGQDIECSY